MRCHVNPVLCDVLFLGGGIFAMFNINDYVLYKHDTCRVDNIVNYNDKWYYVLIPVSDSSLKINVLKDNCNIIRNVMSYDDAIKLIDSMPYIDVILESDKNIENEYKKCLSSLDYNELIKVIKTCYLRNKNRVDNKKKVSDKDLYYLSLAEKYLYNELAISLNISFDEVVKYVKERLEKVD